MVASKRKNVVLISIKPEFTELIFKKQKKYEFRRVLYKDHTISKVIVYASSPVQKVIGEFEPSKILSLSPKLLWNKTCQHAGITEEQFFAYFAGKDIANAIEIRRPKLYAKPLNLWKKFHVKPPQSFIYIK